jgi:hypothetical protein
LEKYSTTTCIMLCIWMVVLRGWQFAIISICDYDCKIITIGQFGIIAISLLGLLLLVISNNHKLPDSNNLVLIIKSGVIENCQPINTTTQMHNIKQLIVTIHEGILNISPNIVVQTENSYIYLQRNTQPYKCCSNYLNQTSY